MKRGEHDSSSDSESALSSDSDQSEKIDRQKWGKFDKFDIKKDKATKFSIRINLDGEQKLNLPPYPLNIIDRSYLVTAFRYHTQLKITAANSKRLLAIFGCRLSNKILSIVFFALVAIIQEDSKRFQNLLVLLYEKYYIFLARLSSPKDLVLNELPMVLGKAILLILEDKIKEKLSLLIEASEGKGGVCSSENMVYLFCTGLFTSNCVSLDTVNELRR